MPNGGLRMVLNAFEAYGYKADPHVVEAFSKYRKTHNEGVFDAYTADIRACRSSHVLTGLPDAYGAAGSLATTAASRCTAWIG
jgi:formate C-acetyltransferase